MSGIREAYRGGFEGRPGWYIAFAYDADLVDQLKATIPASQRSWDEAGKRWWVSDDLAERLLTVLPSFAAFLHQPALFQ